jgi:predicted nucleic acid-binding protein
MRLRALKSHPNVEKNATLGWGTRLEKRTLEKRTMQRRTRTLALLDWLPQVRVAQLSEVRQMIEARRLYSRGIGLTDAHLIASVFINSSTLLWTRDKRLRKAAEDLGTHARLA